MKEIVRKYGGYVILLIGFYICSCITLYLINLIGLGSFNNILKDGFYVALIAGGILFVSFCIKKFGSQLFNK